MTGTSPKPSEQEFDPERILWVDDDPFVGYTRTDQNKGFSRLVENRKPKVVELSEGNITQAIETRRKKTRRSTQKLTTNSAKKLEKKAEASHEKIQEWTAFWLEYCSQNRIRITPEVSAAITYLHWYCFKKKIDPNSLATSGYPNRTDGAFQVPRGSPLDLAKFARYEHQGKQWVLTPRNGGIDYENQPSQWPEVKAFDSEHL